jgi:hypothetical protein
MAQPHDEDTLLAQLREALAAEGIATPDEAEVPLRSLTLDQDLGLDSFQLMRVARHLERAHSYVFALSDWVVEEEEREERPYTVASLLAFIGRHLLPDS